MPPIHRVLETSLYVDDLARARDFYREVLGMEVMAENERFVALNAGSGTVLLLFLRGASLESLDHDGQAIPSHDGRGPLHLAMAIGPDDLEEWQDRLTDAGVIVESRVEWSRGGTSLYFRDPDGHCVELATPGVWPTY